MKISKNIFFETHSARKNVFLFQSPSFNYGVVLSTQHFQLSTTEKHRGQYSFCLLPSDFLDKAQDIGIILLSNSVFSELKDVLFRPKFERYITLERRQEFLAKN
jgi:hypothetical protein